MSNQENIYLTLTREFNANGLAAALSSGQAVVLYKLAIMSKDGDWIVKEDQNCIDNILKVLSKRSAKFRFGAPMDLRWLKCGWSCHFEFNSNNFRVRTDFVSRPPRIDQAELTKLWSDLQNSDLPVVDKINLIKLKFTAREKDYPVIGELAKSLEDPSSIFLYSRSARKLIEFSKTDPELLKQLISKREVLTYLDKGLDEVQTALDKEKRFLIRCDEERLSAYKQASLEWQKKWPEVERIIINLPTSEANKIVANQAIGILPMEVKW